MQSSENVPLGGTVVVTGAAGLVGQNLVQMLAGCHEHRVVAIDKHERNLAFLARANPTVHTLHEDLSRPGKWQQALEGATALVALHAHITGINETDFVRNNITASQLLYETARACRVPFAVHVSSSVVNSIVDDHYSTTKRLQERLFLDSGLPGCVLRPTLMYGWFDPKHLGWLVRFMRKAPVFPIPGHGRYTRQPLYARDFCTAILWCLAHRPSGAILDIVGNERIDYIDMIRAIRDASGLSTPIVRIPYWLFHLLLKLYALFDRKPPFTAEQLGALTAGDDFEGVDFETTFGFEPTPFRDGIRETLCHPVHSQHVLDRT